MQLNKAQQEVVNTHNGPVLVISCPGSGKTTVLIERVNSMIQAGIPSQTMLISTFTNAAAKEMRKRFELKSNAPAPLFTTIHSFCFNVIRGAYGYTADDILKGAEVITFFRELPLINKDSSITDIDEFIKNVQAEITAVRNNEVKLNEYEAESCKTEKFLEIFNNYNEYKKKEAKIDFDDMLFLCRDCFRNNKNILNLWQEKFQYIMIDEFQDTNKVQAEIFYMLADKYKNICVVGDDDQSIYAFRAADSGIMLRFEKTFPACKKISLNTNYRSEPEIIKAASKLIKNNECRFDKEFKSSKTGKGIITTNNYDDSSEQVKGVLNLIKQYHEDGIDYEDMAIIYRNNSQNQPFVAALLKADIPFYTTEGIKDIHDDFIFRDIMSYWRLSQGSNEKRDLQRILNHPSRFLKSEFFHDCDFNLKAMLKIVSTKITSNFPRKKAIDNINDLFHDIRMLKEKNPVDFMKYMKYYLGPHGYLQWLTGDYADWCKKKPDEFLNVWDTLIEEAKTMESMEEWSEYAKSYAEMLESKKRSRKRDGICLTTMHSSKGLEWKIVFLVDANEDITPSGFAETKQDFEEERRAFYVAITRAMECLHLSYTDGNDRKQYFPSRYISEMELDEQKKKTPHKKNTPSQNKKKSRKVS